MNRKQRREQAKEQRQKDRKRRRETPAELNLTKQQMVAGLIRNGITLDDLRKEYDRGFAAGVEQSALMTFKAVYAAVCLALHELYGFGTKRCLDVLNKTDEKVIYSLTSEELIDEVWKKLDLQLDFKEGIAGDRIREAGA